MPVLVDLGGIHNGQHLKEKASRMSWEVTCGLLTLETGSKLTCDQTLHLTHMYLFLSATRAPLLPYTLTVQIFANMLEGILAKEGSCLPRPLTMCLVLS